MSPQRRVPDARPVYDGVEEIEDLDPSLLRAIRATMEVMQARMPPPQTEINVGRKETPHSTFKWFLGCFGSALVGCGAGIVTSYWSMHADVASLKAQVSDLRDQVHQIYSVIEPHYRGASLHATEP